MKFCSILLLLRVRGLNVLRYGDTVVFSARTLDIETPTYPVISIRRPHAQHGANESQVTECS